MALWLSAAAKAGGVSAAVSKREIARRPARDDNAESPRNQWRAAARPAESRLICGSDGDEQAVVTMKLLKTSSERPHRRMLATIRALRHQCARDAAAWQ